LTSINAVSDIVIHGGLPAGLIDDAEFRRDVSSWAGCIAGALTDAEYRDGLAAAGFVDIDLQVTRRYSLCDVGFALPTLATQQGEQVLEDVVSRFASTFVRARAALDLARNCGVTDVYLLTTTAAEFFPRLGFARIARDAAPRVVQTSTEFQSACPASAAAMHVRL
jgi:hypothetical protein